MTRSTTMTNLLLAASDKSFLKERQGKHLNNSPFSQSSKTPKTVPKLKLSKAPNKSDGNRAKKTRGKKREPLIVEWEDNQGKTTFCVQIRRQVSGKKLSLSETFSTMKLAKAWRDRKLAEIELGRIKPENVKRHDTQLVNDILKKRLEDGKPLKRSGVQMLGLLITHPLCQIDGSKIDREWFGSIANALLAREITPQTVACYMTTLSYALKWGARRQMPVPSLVVQDAMEILWEDEVLARSEERERRATLEELDRILEAATLNKRQKIPMPLMVIFAIFSCRRLSEICGLRWGDLRISTSKILVRDMKHPRKKTKRNNVWVTLPCSSVMYQT